MSPAPRTRGVGLIWFLWQILRRSRHCRPDRESRGIKRFRGTDLTSAAEETAIVSARTPCSDRRSAGTQHRPSGICLQSFFLIPSESMEPTLHGCAGCTGDRIVVEKIGYRFGDPEPGDVVVFKGPDSWNTKYVSNRSDNVVVRGIQEVGSWVGLVPPDENDLVKRVIATGGQTVECCDDQAESWSTASRSTSRTSRWISRSPREHRRVTPN